MGHSVNVTPLSLTYVYITYTKFLINENISYNVKHCLLQYSGTPVSTSILGMFGDIPTLQFCRYFLHRKPKDMSCISNRTKSVNVIYIENFKEFLCCYASDYMSWRYTTPTVASFGDILLSIFMTSSRFKRYKIIINRRN